MALRLIEMLLREEDGIDVGRHRDRLSMPVAALSIVGMTEQVPLLKALGDRTHLRASLRLRPGT